VPTANAKTFEVCYCSSTTLIRSDILRIHGAAAGFSRAVLLYLRGHDPPNMGLSVLLKMLMASNHEKKSRRDRGDAKKASKRSTKSVRKRADHKGRVEPKKPVVETPIEPPAKKVKTAEAPAEPAAKPLAEAIEVSAAPQATEKPPSKGLVQKHGPTVTRLSTKEHQKLIEEDRSLFVGFEDRKISKPATVFRALEEWVAKKNDGLKLKLLRNYLIVRCPEKTRPEIKVILSTHKFTFEGKTLALRVHEFGSTPSDKAAVWTLSPGLTDTSLDIVYGIARHFLALDSAPPSLPTFELYSVKVGTSHLSTAIIKFPDKPKGFSKEIIVAGEKRLLNDEGCEAVDYKAVLEEFDSENIAACASASNETGVTIILFHSSRIPKSSISRTTIDSEGRILGVQLQQEGIPDIQILGIYAPNQNQALLKFFTTLEALQGKFDIVLGDFNMVEAPTDRNPPHSDAPIVVKALRRFIDKHSLEDGWRTWHQDEKAYSFQSSNATASTSRIDRIYTTEQVSEKTLNWDIIPALNISDHSMVMVDWFPRDRISTGHGIWTMNSELFQTDDFKAIASIAIAKLCKQLAPLWTKTIIDKQAIEYTYDIADKDVPEQISLSTIQAFLEFQESLICDVKTLQKTKAKERNKVKKKLERKLGRVQAKDRTPKNVEKVKKRTEQLRAYTQAIDRDRRLQTLLTWGNASNYGSKEFYQIGHLLRDDRSLHAIYDESGKLYKKSKKIVQIAESYYSKLYSSEGTNKRCQDQLLSLVTPGDFAKLDRPITNISVEQALSSLSNGSVPGPDGVCHEFYKVFQHQGDQIKLLDCLIILMEVLYRPDKYNKTMPKEWAKGVLKTKVPLFLALLDQEKAYDRVEHIWLWRVLQAFGLPAPFIRAIQGCYAVATTTGHAPAWTYLVRDILLHKTSVNPKMITTPWSQVWSSREPTNTSPSISYFWREYTTHGRLKPLHPSTKADVLRTKFCWKALLATMQNPQIAYGETFDYSTMVNKKGQALTISSTNRSMYQHLLPDAIRSINNQEQDLLHEFKSICIRDNVSIHFTSQEVWASAYDKDIDYPKFSDLLWKMFLGRVRTGEAWMDAHFCPECQTAQTVEHLFWDCPIAKAVWSLAEKVFNQVNPLESLDLPMNYGHLLIWGVKMCREAKVGQNSRYKTWRLLFGEALWTLWITRCEWSYKDIEDFNMGLVVRRFLGRVVTRVQVTVYKDRHYGTGEEVEAIAALWGFNPKTESSPAWIMEILPA
ncbi:hypothetical protein JHW43_009607, partial [Diplocarpon mali]